jgi:hypothetical protein
MVVIYLQGGLGNQLFQYAFGRYLQELRGEELYIDSSHFAKSQSLGETPRALQLNEFHTHFLPTNAQINSRIQKEMNLPLLRRIRNKLVPYNHLLVLNDQSVWNEDQHPKQEILYLKGYFQKENYFSKIRLELLQELQPNYTLLRNHELPENAVSVHVRRGDYVSLTSAAAHHGTCSVEYYNRAMQLMSEKIQNPHFVFFSDDIAWCKTTFGHLSNAHFMEPLEGMRESEDMIWMSRCQHHIIANSSYSWWGAWLNVSPNKIVVAPATWNLAQQTKLNDYVPSNWIQLS